MLPLNHPTAIEQAKLENVAKGICPTCKEKIQIVGTIETREAICINCPFTMPSAMYERIQQQYGKKDGN